MSDLSFTIVSRLPRLPSALVYRTYWLSFTPRLPVSLPLVYSFNLVYILPFTWVCELEAVTVTEQLRERSPGSAERPSWLPIKRRLAKLRSRKLCIET